MHTYEVRPRRDKRGFDLISDALPFGRLWYGLAEDAVGYAKFYSRSHAMIVRVFCYHTATGPTDRLASAAPDRNREHFT